MNRPTSRVSLSSRTALAAAAREGSVTNASPFVCTPTSYTSTPKWSAILSPVMVATRPVTLTVVGAPSSAAAAPLASTSSSRFERFGEADSRLSFLSFLSFFSFFSFFPPSSSRSRFFEDSPIAATPRLVPIHPLVAPSRRPLRRRRRRATVLVIRLGYQPVQLLRDESPLVADAAAVESLRDLRQSRRLPRRRPVYGHLRASPDGEVHRVRVALAPGGRAQRAVARGARLEPRRAGLWVALEPGGVRRDAAAVLRASRHAAARERIHERRRRGSLGGLEGVRVVVCESASSGEGGRRSRRVTWGRRRGSRRASARMRATRRGGRDDETRRDRDDESSPLRAPAHGNLSSTPSRPRTSAAASSTTATYAATILRAIASPSPSPRYTSGW
eukprot:31068-Pelagococcus_subviridis.AAC.2